MLKAKKIAAESAETIKAHLNNEIDNMIRKFEKSKSLCLLQCQKTELNLFAIRNKIDLCYYAENTPWNDRTNDPGFRIAHILELDRLRYHLWQEAECEKLFRDILPSKDDSLSVNEKTETIPSFLYDNTVNEAA